MNYDIRNVGYEFLQAEQCLKENDIEGAITHYDLVIKNYEYADNEYLIAPDHAYTITEFGEEMNFPSINSMVRKAEKELRELRRKTN